MSLGDILKLWDKTEWYTEPRYYYSIIGTPLSGMNESRWYDSKKKKFESGTYFNGKYHFLGLAKPALDHLKLHHKNTVSKLSIFDNSLIKSTNLNCLYKSYPYLVIS